MALPELVDLLTSEVVRVVGLEVADADRPIVPQHYLHAIVQRAVLAALHAEVVPLGPALLVVASVGAEQALGREPEVEVAVRSGLPRVSMASTGREHDVVRRDGVDEALAARVVCSVVGSDQHVGVQVHDGPSLVEVEHLHLRGDAALFRVTWLSCRRSAEPGSLAGASCSYGEGTTNMRAAVLEAEPTVAGARDDETRITQPLPGPSQAALAEERLKQAANRLAGGLIRVLIDEGRLKRDDDGAIVPVMPSGQTTTTPERLEQSEDWPTLVAAVEAGKPISVVAKEHGLGAGELQGALRRSGHRGRSRVVRRRQTPVEASEASVGARVAATPPRSRKGHQRARTSRRETDALLEPFTSKLGTMPDHEIAEKAGVSKWVVRGYRIKQGIDAYNRWTAEGSKARAAAESTPPLKRNKRCSPATAKVAEVHDLVGQLPDHVVAAKIGVHKNTIRNYRQRHGIPLARPGPPGRRPSRRRPDQATGLAARGPRSMRMSTFWAP